MMMPNLDLLESWNVYNLHSLLSRKSYTRTLVVFFFFFGVIQMIFKSYKINSLKIILAKHKIRWLFYKTSLTWVLRKRIYSKKLGISLILMSNIVLNLPLNSCGESLQKPLWRPILLCFLGNNGKFFAILIYVFSVLYSSPYLSLMAYGYIVLSSIIQYRSLAFVNGFNTHTISVCSGCSFQLFNDGNTIWKIFKEWIFF